MNSSFPTSSSSPSPSPSPSISIIISIDPKLFPSSSSSSSPTSPPPSSISFSLPQNAKFPIYEIKRHVQRVTNIPPHIMRLVPVGGNGAKSVTPIDVFPSSPSLSTVTFSLTLRPPRRETFPLCFRTFSESRMDERWNLRFDVNDSILDLKFIMSEVVKTKAENIVFYHWKKGVNVRVQLGDTHSIHHYGLQEGQVIRMSFEIPSLLPGHGPSHRTRVELLELEFPGVLTIGHLWRRALAIGGNHKYLGLRSFLPDGISRGDYEWSTYNEIGVRVDHFISAIYSLGIRKGDRIGIISNNRPEFSILDAAASLQGWVTVPLYDTLGPDAVNYILNHSECSVVIAAANQLKNLVSVKEKCPLVKVIIACDATSAEKKILSTVKSHLYTHTFSQIEKMGSTSKKIPDSLPHPDDIFTICYTSGTTGNPKGALITHRNMVSACAAFGDRFPPHLESVDDTLFSYLPMAHIYERALEINCLRRATAIGFSQGDTTKLVDDVVALKPTMFPGVPRVWQRIFDRISSQVDESNFLSKFLFNKGFESRLSQFRNGDFSGSLWDKIVFQKLANKFGGKLTFMTSGAAPLNSKIAEFLRISFKTNFVEGYGMTESAAACTSTHIENFSYGIVGIPLSCTEVKLVDVEDMGYLSTDKPNPRGEIWMRGANIFKGYYKLPEQTAEVLSADGWLATGDVGTWLPDGNLKIIDRKKNLFKLAQGEYIRPEHIEGVIKQNKFIANCYVHGDSLQNYLVAIIVPDWEQIILWAMGIPQMKSLIPSSYSSSSPSDKSAVHSQLVSDKRVISFLQQQIDEISKSEGLKGFEMVKRVSVIPDDFSSDNGLLTPTMKLKRNVAAKVFAKQISEMYEKGENGLGDKKDKGTEKQNENKIKAKL